MIPRNLLNCNKHHTKTSFLPFRASRFGIKFPSEFFVLSGTAPGRHFSALYVEFMRKLKILGPLQNSVGANMAPKIRRVAPKRLQKVLPQNNSFTLIFNGILVTHSNPNFELKFCVVNWKSL